MFLLGLVGEEHLNDTVQLTPVELSQAHQSVDKLHLLKSESDNWLDCLYTEISHMCKGWVSEVKYVG